MTSIPSCVVAGLICLDVFPDLLGQKDFLSGLQPGQLLTVGPVKMATGGAVANTGLALHRLGITTHLMGNVGDDSFGQILIGLLDANDEQLASGIHTQKGEHTSYSLILSTAETDRIFLHNRGANDAFGWQDVNYDLVSKTDLFHFGYPPAMARMFEDNGRELALLFKNVKATGVTTSLDMCMFDRKGPAGKVDWTALLQRTLPYCDLFLPSIDELLLMLNPDLLDDIRSSNSTIDPQSLSLLAEDLLAMGAKIVMIKLGEKGIYLRTTSSARLINMGRGFQASASTWAEKELWVPVFEANLVGATGAGDTAVAGFLSAILRKNTPEQAITMAAAAGACNVEAADAISGVLSWEETVARIDRGWSRRKLDLPGWTFDHTDQVYRGPGDESA